MKGEAESYEGVKVTFIRGRKPIMIISGEDGKEIETVPLHTITTHDGLLALMKEKGFVKKGEAAEETSVERLGIHLEKVQVGADGEGLSTHGTMHMLYALTGLVAASALLLVRHRRRNRKMAESE
mmetsp:Transcript_46040/g.68563  ORF Transcript_46040/g.68563 Transcript_46040/m.68563 type:complete len:125 (-) Transcript_46040:280-654(-)